LKINESPVSFSS